MCLDVHLSVFILSGTVELLGYADYRFSSNWRRFQPLFLWIFFLLSLLPFWPMFTGCPEPGDTGVATRVAAPCPRAGRLYPDLEGQGLCCLRVSTGFVE